jgi:hypothetical protein
MSSISSLGHARLFTGFAERGDQLVNVLDSGARCWRLWEIQWPRFAFLFCASACAFFAAFIFLSNQK